MPTLAKKRNFLPVSVVHATFSVVHVELRQRVLGEAPSQYAWMWQNSEAKRRALEYLFWQLASNRPPHGVGIEDGRFIFLQEVKNATGRRSRSTVIDATPRQFDAAAEQMVQDWNGLVASRPHDQLIPLNLSELALRGDWLWEPHAPLPHLLGMVPVVLACCAKWHLQDSEFRIMCNALEAYTPSPGAKVPQKDLPSRQMVVLFLAQYAFDLFPGWPEDAKKALAVALRGLHDGPTNNLTVKWAPDYPLRIVGVTGATPETQAILDSLLRCPDPEKVKVPRAMAPALAEQENEMAQDDDDDDVLRLDPECEDALDQADDDADHDAGMGMGETLARSTEGEAGELGEPDGGTAAAANEEGSCDSESELSSAVSDGMGSDDGWGEY